MELIKALKKEHKEIDVKLEELLSHISNHQKLSQITGELKGLLKDHLQNEDENLYPFLNDSNQEELIELSNKFSEVMKKLSQEAMDCIHICETKVGEPSSQEAEHIQKIAKKLQDRIVIEETILFPAIEKYFNK